MSRPFLCSARLSPKLPKSGALVAFALTLGGRGGDVGPLCLPSSTRANEPLLVFAHSLIDITLEPVIFGRHLTPHDAHACAYYVENP